MQPETTGIQAYNVDSIYEADNCPHCGERTDDITAHLERCEAAAKDRAHMARLEGVRWAIHKTLGKVLIVGRRDGMCLVASVNGRYAVPASSINNHLGRLIDTIKQLDLNDEEMDQLINELRIMSGRFQKLSWPALRPGNCVEIEAGKKHYLITIEKKRGSCYVGRMRDGSTVNISPRDIVRIIQ